MRAVAVGAAFVLLLAGCGGENGERPALRAATGPWFGFAEGGFDVPSVAADVARIEADAGARVVRVPVRWADVQPTRDGPLDMGSVDVQVRALARRHVRPLLMVESSPAWAHDRQDRCPDEECPPAVAHFPEWSRFLQELVRSQAAASPVGIEVWNEPNFRINWHTARGPDARRYAQLVRVASRAVRAVAPDLPVVLGGLAPTGEEPGRARAFSTFLRDVLRRVPASAFDGIGLHAYPSVGLPATPAGQFADVLAEVRAARDAAGQEKKGLWITEAGFATGMAAGGGLPARPAQLDPPAQAHQLLALYDVVADASDVRVFLVWKLRDDARSPYENGFGVLYADGRPKPSYLALKRRFG